jgi:hypothetical protein
MMKPVKTRVHRGAFSSSQRQQAVYKALKKVGFMSSMDLTHLCGIVNPAGAVSALRLNGIPIVKKYFAARSGKLVAHWRIGK